MRLLALMLPLTFSLACNSSAPPASPAVAPAATASGAKPAAGAASASAPLTVEALAAEKDVLYLDVRSPVEFASGHLDGAVNIPVGETARMVELIGRKDRPVIVYCAVGGRSAQAIAGLKAEGFTRLVNGVGVREAAAATGKPVVQ